MTRQSDFARSEGSVEDELLVPDKETVEKSDYVFTVHLCRSGLYFDIPPEKSFAEVLLDNGLDVLLACEEGVCGTCLNRVVAGQPDHRDMILSREEKASGRTIAICRSRSLSPVLTLDL